MKLRNVIAKAAILCVLIQAGIASWHAVSMFAAAASPESGQRAAMACHGTGTTTHDHKGDTSRYQDCACCQGVLAGGTVPEGAPDLPKLRLTAAPIFITAAPIMAGRHPLAAESRGPPRRV